MKNVLFFKFCTQNYISSACLGLKRFFISLKLNHSTVLISKSFINEKYECKFAYINTKSKSHMIFNVVRKIHFP